ncbi:uncharacterized protein KY384_008655 [Bacidia gigantensis]|uniref:uncharacterized protein n=1 Tax=Bacidia gigantensis TaxID=2732470 RepID=UPI001D055C09|nr:uncharacterized protein KY384_008655 [Bacidia gigantensis]KAG8527225.1 hypothetical protein KY384_008655 [Bacidia gigantensis]
MDKLSYLTLFSEALWNLSTGALDDSIRFPNHQNLALLRWKDPTNDSTTTVGVILEWTPWDTVKAGILAIEAGINTFADETDLIHQMAFGVRSSSEVRNAAISDSVVAHFQIKPTTPLNPPNTLSITNDTLIPFDTLPEASQLPSSSNQLNQTSSPAPFPAPAPASFEISKRDWPPSVSATRPKVTISWLPNAQTLDTQSVYLAAVKAFKRVAVETKTAVVPTNRGFVSEGRAVNAQLL